MSKELIFASALALYQSNRIPVMLSSTTGTGKTSFVKEFANKLGIPFHQIYAANQDTRAIYGTIYVENGELKIAWNPVFQILVKADTSHLVFFDELNRADARLLNGLLFLIRNGITQYSSFELNISKHYRVAAINPANGLYNTTTLDPAIISSFAQFNFNKVSKEVYTKYFLGNNGFSELLPEQITVKKEIAKHLRSLFAFIINHHSRLIINDPQDEFDLIQKYSREKSPVILIPCYRSLDYAMYMLNLFDANRDNIPGNLDKQMVALLLVEAFLPNELAQIVVTEYFERLNLTWEILLNDKEKFLKFIDDELIDKVNSVIISLIEAAIDNPTDKKVDKAAEVLMQLFIDNTTNKVGQYITSAILGNMDMINQLKRACTENRETPISFTPIRSLTYFAYLTMHPDNPKLTIDSMESLISLMKEVAPEKVGTLPHKVIESLKAVAEQLNIESK